MLSSKPSIFLSLMPSVSRLTTLMISCLFSASLFAAEKPNTSLTSEQALARLSLKHVSYSHYQDDYLNAITDVLVAESKGIWKQLPSDASLEETNRALQEGITQPSQSNLTLIEASLYHYFGMQNEAEKRYKKVIKQSTTHLPTAFLLLSRYYYQQQDYQNVLKWVLKVDDSQLSDEQKGFKYLYQLDAYVRLGKKKQALELISLLDEQNWLPVLSYNSDRLVKKQNQTAKSSEIKDSNKENESWFSWDDEQLSPLIKELEAQKLLQLGMDATEKSHWASAVHYFKQVPPETLRTIEARRWLAWSLMKDGQLDAASKVWRSLTRSPSYLALDAFAMSASVTEKLGDKERALAWFEQGIDYYSDQVETLIKLRSENQKGEWFSSVQSSNDTFWSPVQMDIQSDTSLYLWTEAVWEDKAFQQLLSDHRDLVQISTLLTSKMDYIETFGLMVENRKQGFKKTTDKIQRMEADLKLNTYRQETKAHNQRLDKVADYQDIYAVGTKAQLINQVLLDRVKENLDQLKAMSGYARKHKTTSYESRYEHLRKLYLWEMRESYPENYRRYQREVKDLNEKLQKSQTALAKMKRSKAYAPSRFEGYSEKIRLLNQHIHKTVTETQTLRSELRTKVIAMLDNKLAERQSVAQTYLEQSILASARLRDELAFELGNVSNGTSLTEQLALNGGAY